MIQVEDPDQIKVIVKLTQLQSHRHGSMRIEVRDGKVQMLEITQRFQIA